jgi:O-antigen/teichoic acid export membrane protein
MGKTLNGAFLSFQSIATLAGLGDLGMGGMLNIHTSRLLGQGKQAELRVFLARARAFFLVMAVVGFVAVLLVLPGVLRLWNFEFIAGLGSLPGLAVVGAAAVGVLILNSYIVNLNYGCGNIFWPILPTFLSLQLAILGHWLLARQQCPLWAQYIPYVASGFLLQLFIWLCVRLSHPDLATVRPLTFNWREFVTLFGNSFWIYLYSVALNIYVATDRFLITAGFGADMVPPFAYNHRLCELALFITGSASLASMPKITQWIVSSETAVRGRGVQELLRVNKFQTFLGCCAVLVYLAVNDLFIQFWLGKDFQAPFSWQIAFAANLGITAGGLMGVELAARCCAHGSRVGGIALMVAAFLNLGLSWIAMKRGSIFGIALATVIAQSAAVLFLGWFSSRQMRISWWRLSVRNWLLAWWIPPRSWPEAVLLILVNVPAFFLMAAASGISLKDLREEKIIFQSILLKRKKVQPPHNEQSS